MKKIFTTIVILMLGAGVFAGEREDALAFFNRYVNASNSYSADILDMYADNAKIIREVVKPNSQLVDVNFPVNSYKSQMKINAKLAKIRGYKNYYTNISAQKVSNGYKISALRQPSLSDYKLKCYLVVQKKGGEWKIVEEMMQTKEQIFLKYAK